MNTLLIDTLKDGQHLFFNYYPENDGSGYFSMIDGKPIALVEVKCDGSYLSDNERGLIWGKMVVNSPDFNKTKCIKNLKHELSLDYSDFNSSFLSVVERA